MDSSGYEPYLLLPFLMPNQSLPECCSVNYGGSEMLEEETKGQPGNIYSKVSIFDKY